MSGPAVITGLVGALMLAVGSNVILPVSAMTGGVCDLVGLASSMVFLGLLDGA